MGLFDLFTGKGREKRRLRIEKGELEDEIRGDRERSKFVPFLRKKMFGDELREKEDRLRSYKSLLIPIALILLGIILLSPNITGNVISGLSKTSTNLVGIILIAAGALVITFMKRG